MNKMIQKFLTAAFLLTASAQALAAPNVIVGTDTIVAGGSATIPMTFQADGTVTAFDFRFTFDDSEFAATPSCVSSLDTTGTADATVACSVVGNEVRVLVSGASEFPVPPITAGDRDLGTISFQSQVSTPATVYPLTITQENYFDTNGLSVTPTASTDGSITVQGADAQFTPAPGLLDLGSVQQGGTDPTANVGIDNVGAAGTTLTGTCSETSDPSNAFTLSGDTSFSVLQGDPSDQVTVTCDANLAPNTYSGEMTCTHNGDGTTHDSPAVFNLSCTVTPGPAPAYSSNPAPGSTLDFGTVPKNDPDPTQNVSISNSGDAGTTLTGTCSISTNPNGAYSITSSAGFSVLQGDPADVITVACDTAVGGTHDGGVLSCSHNGSNLPNPAMYTLNCTIPPEPAITTTLNPDPLDLGPVPQNNTDPTGTLTIDNTGDPDSVLDGSCSISGDPEITIQSGGGAYSVNEAGPNHVVTVACDSSNPLATYNATLSCTHDGVGGPASPVEFPVSCQITQPDPAVYGSTPPSGSTLDFNAGGSVILNDPDPTLPLQIRNDADAGDADMEVSCTLTPVTGTAISVDPAVTNVILAPGASQDVDFTCDTVATGQFEATYDCQWSTVFLAVPLGETPQGTTTQESYTVLCEVIDAESEVDPQTPSGTTVTELVEPGGTAQFSFTFDEVLGEGADGELNCSLDDGTTGFTIVSPASFPAPVPSGGSLTVVVEGTDPGGVDSTTDTLRCTYTDTANPEGVEVFYDLVLAIGGAGRFEVQKIFTDDNPGEVLVTISCNTGLPIEQSQTLAEGDFLEFVVVEFDSGEMECSVTEAVPNGYSANYDAAGSDSAFVDDDAENPGCHYSAVEGGDDNICVITNTPDPVDVVITKDWVIEGIDNPGDISTEYELTLFCDGEIVGGSQVGGQTLGEDPQGIDLCFQVEFPFQEGSQTIDADWCKSFVGDSPEVFTAQVIPEFPSTDCHVVEQVFDDSVEVDNGCTIITVSAGQGASCTITNTVFFEGIPTLSQYGMAIMALLMLGIGLVGFRRFA